MSVSFHQCFRFQLYHVSIIPPVLQVSVVPCQYHSTSASFQLYHVSIIPPVLQVSVVPCQYHSTSASGFSCTMSVSFHQCFRFQLYHVSTIPPVLQVSVVPCQYHSTSASFIYHGRYTILAFNSAFIRHSQVFFLCIWLKLKPQWQRKYASVLLKALSQFRRGEQPHIKAD